MREKRNYWVHQCFSKPVHVTFQRGQLRNPEFAKMITSDFDTVVMWDEKLVEIGKNPHLSYR